MATLQVKQDDWVDVPFSGDAGNDGDWVAITPPSTTMDTGGDSDWVTVQKPLPVSPVGQSQPIGAGIVPTPPIRQTISPTNNPKAVSAYNDAMTAYLSGNRPLAKAKAEEAYAIDRSMREADNMLVRMKSDPMAGASPINFETVSPQKRQASPAAQWASRAVRAAIPIPKADQSKGPMAFRIAQGVKDAVLMDGGNVRTVGEALAAADKGKPLRAVIEEPIRAAKGFGSGVGGMVEGTGGATEWLSNGTIGKSVRKYGQTMRDFYSVEDPTFRDAVYSGFGSMATFLIPGMGVARGTAAMSAMPRLAAWLGVGASSVIEAVTESGGTYVQGMEKWGNEKKASSAASKDFWFNLPTLVFTNKFGLFGDKGPAVLKWLKSASGESVQEFTQQVFGNIALEDPAMQGAWESAGVGAITGGGIKMAETASDILETKLAKDQIISPRRSPELDYGQTVAPLDTIPKQAYNETDGTDDDGGGGGQVAPRGNVPSGDVPAGAGAGTVSIADPDLPPVLTGIGVDPFAQDKANRQLYRNDANEGVVSPSEGVILDAGPSQAQGSSQVLPPPQQPTVTQVNQPLKNKPLLPAKEKFKKPKWMSTVDPAALEVYPKEDREEIKLTAESLRNHTVQEFDSSGEGEIYGLWNELIGNGIRPNKDEIEEYNTIPREISRPPKFSKQFARLANPIDIIKQEIRENPRYAPLRENIKGANVDDIYETLRELKKPKRPSSDANSYLFEAARIVDENKDYERQQMPTDEEVTDYNYAIEPEVQFQAGELFESPKENIGQTFDRLVTQARGRGMSVPDAVKYAKAKMAESAKQKVQEQQAKQKEFQSGDGVRGFGTQRRGQSELFQSDRPAPWTTAGQQKASETFSRLARASDVEGRFIMRLVEKITPSNEESFKKAYGSGPEGYQILGQTIPQQTKDGLKFLIEFSKYAREDTGAHEFIHGLKQTGWFRKGEWETLADHFGKPRQTDAMVEESVANGVARYIVNPNTVKVGRVRAILDRIVRLMRRLRNWAKGQGFRTAEDVMNDIIKGRPVKRADAGAVAPQYQAKEQRDLILTHNISTENLIHAMRIGGIPVPSLGITKADAPLEGFGEITLIGDKGLADPKGYAKTQVYGADIYSPRYPNISYIQSGSSLSKLNKVLKPFLAEGERDLYGGDITSAEDLVSNKAFKKFAASRGIEGFHAMRTEAEQLLRDTGAEEKIFQGFTYSGRRRYIPHTLENVVRILKKGLRGGEGFNYGAGSLRAKFTPRFRSLDQIRKAKDLLVSKDAFEKIKEEINNELFTLTDKLMDFHGEVDSFSRTNVVINTLEDAAGMGLNRAFSENGFENVSEDAVKAASDYINKLRNLPTEYFEAKIMREVQLQEFRGAVVPEGTRPDVIDRLNRHGLEVATYKRGDSSDRKRAIKEISQTIPDAMFQAERVEDGKAMLPNGGYVPLANLSKTRRFFKEWFTTERGVGSIIDRANEERLGRILETAFDAPLTGKALKKYLKKNPSEGLSQAVFDAITDVRQMSELPTEIQDTAKKMRADVDALSMILAQTATPNKALRATIERNLGEYLGRHYRLFERKNWRPSAEVVERAKAKMREMHPNTLGKVTDEQMDGVIENMLSRGDVTFYRGDKPISIPQNHFIKRKNIPKEIRNLYGEITDPVWAYLKTMSDMSVVVHNANFLQTISKVEGAFRDTPSRTHFKQIPDAPRWGAVRNKYTSPEINDFLNEAIDPGDSGLFRFVETMIVMPFKWTKTVGSLPSHPRNILGNLMFSVLAGTGIANPINVPYYWKALRVIMGKETTYRETWRELIRARVADTQYWGSEMPKLMAEMISDPVSWPRKIIDMGKWPINKLGELYNNEDMIYRVAAFLKYRDKGMTVNDAAIEVNKWFTNYARLPKGVKLARRVGLFGPFLSFKANVARIMYNAARESAQQAKRGNFAPAMRLAFVLSLNPMLKAIMASINGIDDDDEKNLEKLQDMGPVWRRNSSPIYYRIASGEIKTFDLGYILPTGDYQKAAKAALRGDLESFVETIDLMQHPVIDAINILFNNYNGKNKRAISNPNDPMLRQKADEIAEFLRQYYVPASSPIPSVRGLAQKKYEPGLLTGYQIKTLYDAYHGVQDRFGRTKDFPEELKNFATGIRTWEIRPEDIIDSFRFRLKAQEIEDRKEYSRFRKMRSISREELSKRTEDFKRRLASIKKKYDEANALEKKLSIEKSMSSDTYDR